MLLIAGYETTANTLGFIAYNLATNPEHQRRLIQEIDDVLGNHVNKMVGFRKIKILNLIVYAEG